MGITQSAGASSNYLHASEIKQEGFTPGSRNSEHLNIRELLERPDSVGLSDSARIFQKQIKMMELEYKLDMSDEYGYMMQSSNMSLDDERRTSGMGKRMRPVIPDAGVCTVEELKALKTFLQDSLHHEKKEALTDKDLMLTLETLIQLTRYQWTEQQQLALSIVKTMVADISDVKDLATVGPTVAPVCMHLLSASNKEAEEDVALRETTKTAAMSVLMNLARVIAETVAMWSADPETAKAMDGIRRIATDRCVISYIAKGGLIGLMAANCAAYLIGAEDDTEYQSLISKAGIPRMLCYALKTTLEDKDVAGARWRISELVLAVLNCSFNDENKASLVENGVIDSMMVLCEGQHYENRDVVQALRTLMELSFCSAGIGMMQKLNCAYRLQQAASQARDGPKEQLQTISGSMIVSVSDNGRLELSRMVQHTLRTNAQGPGRLPATTPKTHIIATYATGDKKAAGEICTELNRVCSGRKGGMEVVSGWESFKECRKQADGQQTIQEYFDTAAMAICFVSTHYKKSYRCRFQAEIMQALNAAGQLRVVFVELKDQGVAGGWLGKMVETISGDGADRIVYNDAADRTAVCEELATLVKMNSQAGHRKQSMCVMPAMQFVHNARGVHLLGAAEESPVF
jgi:hypothetical protein